jgi:succinylglutamate desuccinylase
MQVEFVAGLHGDETLPIKVLKRHGVKHLIGNPAAIARNVRYIEKDMNASFNTSGNTLEGRRARELLEMIFGDMVIDLHSTSAKQDPISIVVDPKLIPFASTFNLPVVLMKYNPKQGHSRGWGQH